MPTTKASTKKTLAILDKIILPEFLPQYQDWEVTATETEMEGLALIDFIFESRGQQKYPILAKRASVFLNSKQDFDYDATVKYFRKKETQSRYSVDYGYIKKTIKPPPNLFAYKKVSELQFKIWLTRDAKVFLDQWLLLNDFAHQEIVSLLEN
jgi:hypothetical protein